MENNLLAASGDGSSADSDKLCQLCGRASHTPLTSGSQSAKGLSGWRDECEHV